MRRREFMLLLGGVMTVARPVHARHKPMPVIGLLASGSRPKIQRTWQQFARV
jgi:hypothetical protein